MKPALTDLQEETGDCSGGSFGGWVASSGRCPASHSRLSSAS
jgi:hypothetical protein